MWVACRNAAATSAGSGILGDAMSLDDTRYVQITSIAKAYINVGVLYTILYDTGASEAGERYSNI